MGAKHRFATPESRPAFRVAEIEVPLRIDQDARRVSGFFRKAAVDGDWLESQPFDYALAELDLAGQTGGPVAKIQKAILAKLVADGKLPAGAAEGAE